jgi:hypothetical protein
VLKHTIKYMNFNDEEVTENLYFHMSEADLLRLDASFPEGLAQAIEKMTKEEDRKAIFEMFEAIVSASYGIKSEDGSMFLRNEEIRTKFLQTAAYEALLIDLASNEEIAVRFFNGLVPKSVRQNGAVIGSLEASVKESIRSSDKSPRA